MSNYAHVQCGVPQGSILGPLLFILYINDLNEYLTTCTTNLYADDTAIYYSGDSQIDIILALRLELDLVKEWLRANKLTLNIAKTKSMYFGLRQTLNKLNHITLSIDGQELEQVQIFKYLGIMLDEALTFEHHVTYVCKKANQKNGVLRKIRKFLTQKLTLMLYKSLVLPQFDYVDVVYMTATNEQLSRLQLIQNKSCRIILRAHKRTNIAEMHTILNLPMLDTRRNNHLSALCHKNIYNSEESSLKHVFNKVADSRSRTTRHSSKMNMIVPNIKSTKGRLSITYRGPRHWNSLTNLLKAIENHDTFKRNLYKIHDQTLDNHPT